MRQVIARWESRRGKDWVEVYKDDYGYGYHASGGGGSFGDAMEEQALAHMQRQIDAGCFCSQRTPMKRVEVGLDPWVVLYRDDSMRPGDPPKAFACRAADGDHAEQQCYLAQPACLVVWAMLGDTEDAYKDYDRNLEEV